MMLPQQQNLQQDAGGSSQMAFPLSSAAGGSSSVASPVVKQEQTPKESYRQLKRRFKFLVFENECYQEELRNLQRKLLKLSRDKKYVHALHSFLLDRLMLYEKLSDSSDESDSSSVTKIDEKDKKPKRKSRPAQPRKKPTEKKENVNGGGPQQQVKKEPKDDSMPGGDAAAGGSVTKPRQAKQETPQQPAPGPLNAADLLAVTERPKECQVEIEKLLPDVMAQYRVERSPAQFDYIAGSDNNLGL